MADNAMLTNVPRRATLRKSVPGALRAKHSPTLSPLCSAALRFSQAGRAGKLICRIRKQAYCIRDRYTKACDESQFSGPEFHLLAG